jgi:DNA (cytosine-5)-methyltransferase 1
MLATGRSDRKFTVLDLFAGAGGFSLGFDAAGFETLAVIEIDSAACDTLHANFPDAAVVNADIAALTDDDILSFPRPDIIVGGPPCQGFSVAGPTQYGLEDPRNLLFRKFIRFVELLHPHICIIENVPGIRTRLTAAGATVPEIVEATLAPHGYSTTVEQFDAADFGVPQHRRRAMIISVRSPIRWLPPECSHGEQATRSLFAPTLSPYVTVGQAISDLPRIQAGEGTDDCLPYENSAENDFQARMRVGSPGVANHIAMKHTPRLVARFQSLQQGQSLKDVASTAVTGVEIRQVQKRTGVVNDRPYKYNNYRLDSSRPSLAVAASFQSSFIHPWLDRNLTAREAARLMSFPDRFMFCGARTSMSWEKSLSQYNQIGNAVCPALAEAIAHACHHSLEEASVEPQCVQTTRHGRAALARFNMATSSEQVGPFETAMPTELLEALATAFVDACRAEGKEDDIPRCFKSQGFQIPLHALSLSLLIATDPDCLLCDREKPPHACHSGAIPFLISKSDLRSLVARGKDHGLDYHLRRLLGISHQCAHIVGDLLNGFGFAHMSEMINSRTGRRVWGIAQCRCPPSVEALRTPVTHHILGALGGTAGCSLVSTGASDA